MGNYAATFGLIFLMSLFLQYAKALSPRQAGLVLLTQPLLQVVASPIAGRLAERFNITRVATCGMLASSAGLLLAAVTTDAGRITSYNVCYTKLLREDIQALILLNTDLRLLYQAQM